MTSTSRSGPRYALTAMVSIGLMTAASRRAEAQLSLAEAASDAKQAYDFVKGLYDAYKAGQGFLQPEPTTAQLIADAVAQIQTLTIDSNSATAWAHANTALSDYKDAVSGGPGNALYQQVDSEAHASLTELEGYLTIGNDVRYAHILGPVFASLLPIYLSVHLAGQTWGSPSSQAQLEQDFISWAQTGLQIDYDMIGGTILNNPNLTDSTTTSQLGKWVTASATGGPFGTTTTLAAAYFQTDPAVQAVQRAAASLVSVLQDAGTSNPTLLYDSSHNFSVTVDVGGWTNNWRGISDGFWTAIQPYVYGVQSTLMQCPRDFGMISVRQMQHGMAGYLCTHLPGIPVRNLANSTYPYSIVQYTCDQGGFCSYTTRCADTDIVSSAIFGYIQCVHRVDSQTETIPPRGAEQSTLQNFPGLPEAGAYFDLPPGMFLTGIDPTDYTDNNFGYYYAPTYPSSMVLDLVLSIVNL